MNFKLVADSSLDLPKNLVKDLDIDILHVLLTDGEKEYKDTVDIFNSEVYDNMKKGIVYKTSQIPLNTYVEKYEYYAKNNIPMISVVMSSGLSSTYKASENAVKIVKEKYPDSILYSYDSKCCTLGYGYLCYLIANKLESDRKENKNTKIEEIEELIKFTQEHLVSTASLEDLTYLARGGRLKNTSAFIANALNVRVFLHADSGYLELLTKVRGHKKMLKKYMEIIEARMGEELKEKLKNGHSEDVIFLLEDADNEEVLNEIKENIKEKYNLKDNNFIISQIGATVGAHVGPKTICMFFLDCPLPEKFR